MEKFFKDRSIGNKLLISFGTVIVIYIVTILIAVSCIRMINSKMEDFYNRPYVNSAAQMEMRKDVQYAGKQLLWAMTTDDAKETEEHIAATVSSGQNVAKNLELLQKNFSNKELV